MNALSLPALAAILIAGALVSSAGGGRLEAVTVPVERGDKEVEGDEARLQGTWTVITAEASRAGSAQFIQGGTLKIAGDRITMIFKGARGGEAVRIVLDPQKDPKTIDHFPVGAAYNPKVPLLGIYALEKDRLKLCWSKTDGRDRPTAFAVANPRSRHILLVLQRQKP